jgi:hypothetical protein
MQPIPVRTATGMAGPGPSRGNASRSPDGPYLLSKGPSIARPVGALPRLARFRWAASVFHISPLFLPSNTVALPAPKKDASNCRDWAPIYPVLVGASLCNFVATFFDGDQCLLPAVREFKFLRLPFTHLNSPAPFNHVPRVCSGD